MSKPRALVLRAPGSNCDHETEFALERAGAAAERVHINRFLAGERRLDEFDLLVIPGGFTFADDIAAGRVLTNKLRTRLWEPLQEFVAAGRPTLGICNGFQILLQLGLLQPTEGGLATLSFNDSGRFECRWSRIRVGDAERCPALAGLGPELSYPVAHGEGKLIVSSEGLASLEAEGRIAFRYATESLGEYPANPNGSAGDIAGLCDKTGRILGLMPHPERALARRREPAVAAAGLKLFENLVAMSRS